MTSSAQPTCFCRWATTSIRPNWCWTAKRARSGRQAVDYSPFGGVTAIYNATGTNVGTSLNALDTTFAHHGDYLDEATGLQQKGQRRYSPDTGRFVSEDPIEEGSNWYLFAGNDPVNQADPSGLSQAGHPARHGDRRHRR